jgi:hypothetical protein
MRLRQQKERLWQGRTAKIAEWAQRDSATHYHTPAGKWLYASQINAARRQHSRQAATHSPELAAKQHQPNTHLNPSRKLR